MTQCEVRRCDNEATHWLQVTAEAGEVSGDYRCCLRCAGELAAFHRGQGASVVVQSIGEG